MRTVIFTCDRCEQEVKLSGDLCKIKVTFTNADHRDYTYHTLKEMDTKIPEVEWCGACMAKAGLASFNKPKDVEVAPVPTMEDFIRDMVSGMVSDELSNHNP